MKMTKDGVPVFSLEEIIAAFPNNPVLPVCLQVVQDGNATMEDALLIALHGMCKVDVQARTTIQQFVLNGTENVKSFMEMIQRLTEAEEIINLAVMGADEEVCIQKIQNYLVKYHGAERR